ncbi:hypothetical protein E2C01_046218 [Portunus trituberculatus]|uniref:Uncharacterized protein n=1 Tax=Portunus trituberculatus TaxID=210409 RepID=A0A5B7FX95_PORTR|nr:hypothetical protein [Portunus trituberculatus]
MLGQYSLPTLPPTIPALGTDLIKGPKIPFKDKSKQCWSGRETQGHVVWRRQTGGAPVAGGRTPAVATVLKLPDDSALKNLIPAESSGGKPILNEQVTGAGGKEANLIVTGSASQQCQQGQQKNRVLWDALSLTCWQWRAVTSPCKHPRCIVGR